MTRVFAAAGLVAGIVASASAVRAQNPTRFTVRLSPVPVAAQQAGTVSGSGSVTATLTGATLSITGRFEGLGSPATVARIHRGTKTGVRGPVLFELEVSKAMAGTIGGKLELTPQQVEDLGRERFYVQLQSDRYPEGHLWGWLMRQETR